jgi:hypothetical protein
MHEVCSSVEWVHVLRRLLFVLLRSLWQRQGGLLYLYHMSHSMS